MQDPLDAAIRTVQTADNAHFKEAADAREEARTLLNRTPVTSPRFVSWAWQVAQLYQNASLGAEARNVLEQALNRSVPRGDSHASHVALLIALGDFWQRDGNLLKAVGFFEQAAAAPEAAPPGSAQPVPQGFVYYGGEFYHSAPTGSRILAYIRLANLYQWLGRPQAIVAMEAQAGALPTSDASGLAQFYAQRGEIERAAEIYRRLAEESSDPQVKAGNWQMVAGFAVQQEHFNDAVAAMQQAIAAVKSAERTDNDAVLLAMYRNLAGYLRSAGFLDDADRLHQWLLEQYGDKYPQAGTLFGYSDHLVLTKRAAEAESLLIGYVADHPNMDQRQKSNVFWNLATIADQIRNPKADQYRETAQALQPVDPPPPPPPAGQIRIAAKLQEAEVAVRQKRLADAYLLTLEAANMAEQAADGQWIALRAPLIATSLAMGGASDKADEIYDRVFALAQTWKATTMEPIIALARAHAAFLQNRPERLGEVPAAIERFYRLLIEAHGPDSAKLAEPVRMRLEFERAHLQWPLADGSARELLKLQESLSGNTSDPYLGDLQIAARTYEAAGDYARALPLFRQAVPLSDLLATPRNLMRRSQTRMDAGLALARAGQFEEAEKFAEEAVALQSEGRRAPLESHSQLEQIRQMKLASANFMRTDSR